MLNILNYTIRQLFEQAKVREVDILLSGSYGFIHLFESSYIEFCKKKNRKLNNPDIDIVIKNKHFNKMKLVLSDCGFKPTINNSPHVAINGRHNYSKEENKEKIVLEVFRLESPFIPPFKFSIENSIEKNSIRTADVADLFISKISINPTLCENDKHILDLEYLLTVIDSFPFKEICKRITTLIKRDSNYQKLIQSNIKILDKRVQNSTLNSNCLALFKRNCLDKIIVFIKSKTSGIPEVQSPEGYKTYT